MATKKETKKSATTTAAVKETVKTTATAKEVKNAEPAKKIETKKAETKSIETKKDTTKAIETRAGILKDAEAKTEKKAVKKTAPKKTTKKAATKVEYFLQFGGKEFTDKDIYQEVKNVWTKELKNKVGDMKSVQIYVKPEEEAAYYVINGETTGKIDL